MGAVSDIVNMGSWGRMRMWLLAIAVAILGTHALQLAGLIDLSRSFYVRANLTWLSYILGGFLFGVGMTLGSGCARTPIHNGRNRRKIWRPCLEPLTRPLFAAGFARIQPHF